MNLLNETHDPARRSWVASANDGATDFPIQNLPFGVFQRLGGVPQGGVAIGDQIVDLRVAIALGLFEGEALVAAGAAAGSDLLPLLTLGTGAASRLRARLSAILAADSDICPEALLVPQGDVAMLLPTRVRHFTDMCASTYHIGRFAGCDERGEPICPPVFRTVPVGYDGRAGSVVVSGTPVNRPNGTWREKLDSGDLRFGPEPFQDYELEMGIWFGGAGNTPGEPMSMAAASTAVFGLCLLNDWSSRGIQLWENMLGPFLGKSLATTVSPWIVTAEALAPFRTNAMPRPHGDPAVPWHLDLDDDQSSGGFDITLETWLDSRAMRAAGFPDARICQTNFRHMYWTAAQMLAHHASNGCGLAPGDLVGSGTCSGPELEAAACLFERLATGPLALPGGEQRTWLEDGDRITLRGRATREGFVSIGFGSAAGDLHAAPSWPGATTGQAENSLYQPAD